MKLKGTKIVLNSIPAGIPKKDDFRLKEFDVSDPDDGQFLAETIFTSPSIRMSELQMLGSSFQPLKKEKCQEDQQFQG